MDIIELKAKAFDLIAIKERHLIEVEKLSKEIQAIVQEIEKAENKYDYK